MVTGMGRALQVLGIEKPVTASWASLPGTAGDVAQVSDLPPAVAQAFGINVSAEAVSRSEALSIPAVRRGVQVIAGTIATFPLVAQRVEQGEDGRTARTNPDRASVRRSLLEQPDPNLTASQWKMRVVTDLVCYPVSWCRVAGRDTAGFPMWLEHLDYRYCRVDAEGKKFYYGSQEIPARDVVRFDGIDDGLLKTGAVTLRTALKLEAAVRRYADNDVPLGVLRDESQASKDGRDTMTKPKVQQLLDDWTAGALKRTTRYIGRLKYEPVQFDAAKIQLAEARERSDVAIAQLLNLESQQINAPSETGMTYSNKEQVAAERVTALSPYMAAITERLSMPDLTPRGQVVNFDTTKYVRGTTTELVTAAVAATGGKPIMERDEARARFLDLPPMEATA